MLFLTLALLPHLYLCVGGTRVDSAVIRQNQGVNRVLVRVFYGLQTFEVRGSPYFKRPVPGSGVEEGAVVREREGGNGVHVMHPRALFVAAHLDVVLGGE